MSAIPVAIGAVSLLTLLTFSAQDVWVRRVSVTVVLGIVLTVLASLFAGCSPSEPFGPAAARFVEVHGG